MDMDLLRRKMCEQLRRLEMSRNSCEATVTMTKFLELNRLRRDIDPATGPQGSDSRNNRFPLFSGCDGGRNGNRRHAHACHHRHRLEVTVGLPAEDAAEEDARDHKHQDHSFYHQRIIKADPRVRYPDTNLTEVRLATGSLPHAHH